MASLHRLVSQQRFSIQSYRRVVVQGILEDVPVERMMRASPPTVPSHISVSTLVHDHVMKTDNHAFPVLDSGQLVGIVTLEDVRAASRDAWETTAVGEIMTPVEQLTVTSPEEDAADALSKLRQRDLRQLPVLSDGTLVGCLRRRDIVKWLQLHSELEVG